MRLALIVSLLLAVAAAIFAIQNPNETTLVLGPWEITASTALVIIGTFVLGALVGILVSLGSRVRQRRRKRLEPAPDEPLVRPAGGAVGDVPSETYRSHDL